MDSFVTAAEEVFYFPKIAVLGWLSFFAESTQAWKHATMFLMQSTALARLLEHQALRPAAMPCTCTCTCLPVPYLVRHCSLVVEAAVRHSSSTVRPIDHVTCESVINCPLTRALTHSMQCVHKQCVASLYLRPAISYTMPPVGSLR